MPYLFVILLKINLVLLLFAGAYYLVLRRITFYTINRIFLMFGIIFSTLYPFINLTNFFHQQQQLNPSVAELVPKLSQVYAWMPMNFLGMHWQILTMLFYFGVTLMAVRLIIQFISLYKMHRKSAPGTIATHPVRILNQAVSPFSFWQTIYINPLLHHENELATIVAHEQVHVKEWHTLDILLAELSVVFYWFNPGMWLMKKAIKENLEFITDQKILNKGVDKKAYQYSLLDVGNLVPAAEIVNNFNLSDLKKRIKMMNTRRSSRLTLSRYLLVVPALLLITLACTIAKKEIKAHLVPLQHVLVTKATRQLKVEPELALKPTRRKKNTATLRTKTVSTFSFVINNINDELDSLFVPIRTKVIQTVQVTMADVRTPSRMLLLRTDSIPRAQGKDKSSSFSFQLGEVQSNLATPTTISKVIVVRAGGMSKNADSLSIPGNVTYFLNGEKISKDDVSTLVNPDAIGEINVNKRSTISSIHIITRKDK